MSELARLYQASAHALPMIKDGEIQAVVCSPPYFGLRVYDGEQQIDWPAVSYSPMAGLPPIEVPAERSALGNEKVIESYIAHLILCAREWRRVLADDGVCFVNIADSYANNPSTTKIPRGEQGNGRGAFRIPAEVHNQVRR